MVEQAICERECRTIERFCGDIHESNVKIKP